MQSKFTLSLALASLSLVMLLGSVSAVYSDSTLTTTIHGDSSADSSARVDTDVSVDSDIEITSEDGYEMSATTSDGTLVSILVTSREARDSAATTLDVQDCSNCTVRMEEERYNGETRAVYNVETEKNAKLFGFINTNMETSANIDVETGAVLSVEKPWWSFLASVESSSSVSSSSRSSAG